MYRLINAESAYPIDWLFLAWQHHMVFLHVATRCHEKSLNCTPQECEPPYGHVAPQSHHLHCRTRSCEESRVQVL